MADSELEPASTTPRGSRRTSGSSSHRYGQTVDDRDIQGSADPFTADATMRSQDGVMNARGREAIVEMFHGRFAQLGPSLHYTHDQIVTFDDQTPTRRSDPSRRTPRSGGSRVRWLPRSATSDGTGATPGNGDWAYRLLKFFFRLPAGDRSTRKRLGDRMRMRAYATRPADWPGRQQMAGQLQGTLSWHAPTRRREDVCRALDGKLRWSRRNVRDRRGKQFGCSRRTVRASCVHRLEPGGSPPHSRRVRRGS